MISVIFGDADHSQFEGIMKNSMKNSNHVLHLYLLEKLKSWIYSIT